MTVWMYYESDEANCYYNIKLFTSPEKAKAWAKKRNDSYGRVAQVEVE